MVAFAVLVGCGGEDSAEGGGTGGQGGSSCKGPTGAERIAQAEVPRSLTINDTDVFWSDSSGSPGGGVVRRVPKAGGSADMLAERPGLQIVALAASASQVFFAADVVGQSGMGEITSVSLAGAATQAALATAEDAPRALAVSEDSVVWVNLTGPDKTGHVMKLPIAGGTAEELATDAQDSRSEIALSSDSAFWTSAAGTPRVSRVPLAGGIKSVVVQSDSSNLIMCVAVDGDDLYFTRYGTSSGTFEPTYNHDGTVEKVGASGGALTELASGQERPVGGLAVRDGWVYWLNSDGSVAKVPTAGGNVDQIVPPSSGSGPSIACALAVDDCHVYFIWDRAIYRARR